MWETNQHNDNSTNYHILIWV
ncbi:unnamed protein product [Spirodela intermedia]|uniref:Uncharacterized protein n=1 Tax=Spirodela intermedia TaxID=51605 RepID=A0A7I8IHZ1_SPIIN|nr:unnamed protein product [Spirodela intermedia]CAA6657118.1 unnamed protein product [Spirodela intermedia]